ncbi:acyl-CoA dehydrogenase family protein [Paracraurococcus ruber]|uniref:Pimeloyl-CoA dehydrogenase small subunit n=1 Tax=Paracraurococcus ruber TaxID=77675 RepID=A0ABS1CTJ0_9PROT|nr:acyl-CoA dehydrogenase family protein [Paracraurococcus ruber]MBK1657663.1 pimeloyl-CoA dehydrogenase small subunit [Paracraurococcus ruber]TDG32151.1 pimeloyl-CoA dehydrogenase small subunit [Paracraurococcus ruber]
MDFDLTEEQRLLQDSVARLLADKYGFEQRKAYMKSAEGWSREVWAQYAELGLLGLPFAEDEGGFGGGHVETMLVAEQLGKAIALEPWIPTVVIGGGFLRHGASAELRAELVPQIAAGDLMLAFAHTERQSRYDLHDVAATAKKDGSGWVLNGRKGMVIHGDSAGKLVVTARTAGGQRDAKGIGVFLVDAAGPGVTRRGYRTVDGQRAAEVELTDARAEAVLGNPEDGLPLVDQVVDETIVALAAEAVGCMQVAHDMTIDYMKTRKQFDRPIASFQALQHRAADMLVQLEQARSMSYYAAMGVEERDPVERRKNMASVKAQIGRSARFVGQQSIQLHGGIAMTMEYACGHYFKRLTVNDAMFGDADHWVRFLANNGGLVQAA